MHLSNIKVRVRYAETDQMGYVHHGNYATYLEMGRIAWLQELGISYNEMEKNGVMLPVHSLSIRYLKPAFYDNVLRIETAIKKMPTVRIKFNYKIFNPKEELIATAETTLIFVDRHSGKPIQCPSYISDKLHLN